MRQFQKIVRLAWFSLPLLMTLAGCGNQTRIIKASPAPESPQVVTSPKPLLPQSNVDSLVEAGVVAFEQNDSKGASGLLQQAFEMDSLDWRPPYLLGRIAAENREFEQADRWLSTGLSHAPNDPQIRSLIYELLGYNCEQQGEYGKAKLHYTTALQLNGESAFAHEGLKRLQVVGDISR